MAELPSPILREETFWISHNQKFCSKFSYFFVEHFEISRYFPAIFSTILAYLISKNIFVNK